MCGDNIVLLSNLYSYIWCIVFGHFIHSHPSHLSHKIHFRNIKPTFYILTLQLVYYYDEGGADRSIRSIFTNIILVDKCTTGNIKYAVSGNVNIYITPWMQSPSSSNRISNEAKQINKIYTQRERDNFDEGSTDD